MRSILRGQSIQTIILLSFCRREGKPIPVPIFKVKVSKVGYEEQWNICFPLEYTLFYSKFQRGHIKKTHQYTTEICKLTIHYSFIRGNLIIISSPFAVGRLDLLMEHCPLEIVTSTTVT